MKSDYQDMSIEEKYIEVPPNNELGQKICDMFYGTPYLEFISTIRMAVCKVSEACEIKKESFGGIVNTFIETYHEMIDERVSGEGAARDGK